MIELQQVSKSWDKGNTFAVHDINLIIPQGKTLALLGSSGCGKTTLLKLINRLLKLSHGQILLEGKNIQHINIIELRHRMGYVIQHVGLFPHLTVAENISIILRLQKQTSRQQRKRACELLEWVNLAPTQFADLYPHQLSGGQQQRVGVARALANDPPILLLDEPFGALDTLTRQELQKEILRLKRQLAKTMIIVTHDIEEAFRLGDQIAIMHQGKIEQIDSAESLCRFPATPFVQAFLQNFSGLREFSHAE